MIKQRNIAFYATIPVNVVMILWVWIGRAFFGAGGWWILLFIFTVVPVLAVALTVTTILAFTQRQPASAGRLTISQFWCLIGLWASLFLFGFFVVDFGDTKESERSAFTLFTGRAGLDASNVLSVIFIFLSLAFYIGLLALLIIGQQGRQDRKLRQRFEAGTGDSPAWPTQPTWSPPQPGGPAAQPAWDSNTWDSDTWDSNTWDSKTRDSNRYPWVGPEAAGPTVRPSEPPGPADQGPGQR